MTSGITLVTGANGFLGRRLVRYLARFGQVRALARTKESIRDLESTASGTFACELPDQIDSKAFEAPAGLSIRAVVHAAYSIQDTNRSRAIRSNWEGTQALLRLSRKLDGCQFIFISSFSAHPKALSYYGRSKFELEQILDPSRDLILRPGTIIGDGGVFARTREMVRKLPLLPIFFDGGVGIQTIWVDDICEAIRQAIELQLRGRLLVAHPTPISLLEFYSGIASIVNRRPRFIRIPGDLALLGIRMLEKLHIRFPVTSENLLGFKSRVVADTTYDLKVLGLNPLSFKDSLAAL